MPVVDNGQNETPSITSPRRPTPGAEWDRARGLRTSTPGSSALCIAQRGVGAALRARGIVLGECPRLPERPKARRRVCGQCRNDGLDEKERLGALAGEPS